MKLSKTWWNLSNSYNYRTFLLEFFMDGCVEIRSMAENSLELVFYYRCVCNCKYEREVFNASEVYVCHFFLKNLYLLTYYYDMYMFGCAIFSHNLLTGVSSFFYCCTKTCISNELIFFSRLSLSKRFIFSNSVFQKDFCFQGENWKMQQQWNN